MDGWLCLTAMIPRASLQSDDNGRVLTTDIKCLPSSCSLSFPTKWDFLFWIWPCMARHGFCLALWLLWQPHAAHNIPSTLHTHIAKLELLFITHCSVQCTEAAQTLTPGGCMTLIAVSNLVQTVYIWGANKSLYAHYPYPYPKYLPQNVEKLLSVTYVRYWRHGIRVMPHNSSLIKRGDISKDTSSNIYSNT